MAWASTPSTHLDSLKESYGGFTQQSRPAQLTVFICGAIENELQQRERDKDR
jgi:hypothetical protein